MPEYSSINLHPTTHMPSTLKLTTYDVIAIGSGWAGRIATARVVKAGMTAIIVENELVGGDCPFWACVPSKALLRPGSVFDTAKAVNGVKQHFNASHGLDAEAVLARRDMFTAGYDDGKILVPMVENAGVTIVRGHGSLASEKRVLVRSSGGEVVTLEATHAVILATGSEAVIPNIPGLKDADPWGPRQATSSSVIPEHLIVLGAGAVGCEMATVYASLGSKVSIVSSREVILPRFDSQVGEIVRKNMEKSGIKVYVSARAQSVSKDEGSVRVELSNGDIIRGSQILVAIGRKPKTNGLGIEKIIHRAHDRSIDVDESLCVTDASGNWLYAAGDINGRAPLTHYSKYEGRIVANAIIAQAHSEISESQTTAVGEKAIAQVVFTNPEVASVGHTRTSATKAGIKFQEVAAPLATLGASLHMEGFEPGWAQWIIEEGSNKLLGATFVGFDCAELIHGCTVAIVGGMTLDQLSHAVPSFPTMSEVYLNLIDASGI